MKRITRVSVLMFATLALCQRLAVAQVQVSIAPQSPDADNFAANLLGTDAGTLAQQLQAQVSQLFQATNSKSFLRDFQNAQSFSAKGLGVDYASEATYVEGGATLSLASNIDKAYKPSGSYTDPPISGGGASFSLMAGLGLGLFGIDPLMIFGNWFKGSASLGQLDGDYHNWGFHAQLRLFGPSRSGSATSMLVRWGGIAFTSGADYARLTLKAKKAITSTINMPSAYGDTGPVTVTSDGNLVFTVNQTTWTVPIEITTSLRLLSLVTVYGGIGIDLQLGGGSDMNVNMTAQLRGTYRGQTYANLGTARVYGSESVSPSPARLREIIGVQINALIVRIFFQANIANGSPMLTSLAGGVRLAY